MLSYLTPDLCVEPCDHTVLPLGRRKEQRGNRSLKLFILLVLGATAGVAVVAAMQLLDMIFWARTAVDLSTLLMNIVCGVSAGMIVIALTALLFNAAKRD